MVKSNGKELIQHDDSARYRCCSCRKSVVEPNANVLVQRNLGVEGRHENTSARCCDYPIVSANRHVAQHCHNHIFILTAFAAAAAAVFVVVAVVKVVIAGCGGGGGGMDDGLVQNCTRMLGLAPPFTWHKYARTFAATATDATLLTFYAIGSDWCPCYGQCFGEIAVGIFITSLREELVRPAQLVPMLWIRWILYHIK